MTSIKLQITNKNQYANIQIKFGILKLNIDIVGVII